MTKAQSTLAKGAKVHLAQATHAGGHFLAAHTAGELLSLHRQHARVAVMFGERRLVLRWPLALVVTD